MDKFSRIMEKYNWRLQQDHFLRLPDEVIITIFSKLSKTHFKFLCQNVSLVSKRFVCLLRRIPSIFITLPSAMLLDHPQSFNPSLMLKKFVETRSLHVEFVLATDHISVPMYFKWKALHNTKSLTFVFLSSTSIVGKEEEDQKEILINNWSFRNHDLSLLWFSVSNTWLSLMKVPCSRHPFLQSVKVSDSEKHGALCIRDEKQISLVDEGNNVKLDGLKIKQRIGIRGYCPVLFLPASRFVMQGVVFLMCRIGEEARYDDDDDHYDNVLNWDFGEEDNLFGEAVTTFLKDHKNKLIPHLF